METKSLWETCANPQREKYFPNIQVQPPLFLLVPIANSIKINLLIGKAYHFQLREHVTDAALESIRAVKFLALKRQFPMYFSFFL